MNWEKGFDNEIKKLKKRCDDRTKVIDKEKVDVVWKGVSDNKDFLVFHINAMEEYAKAVLISLKEKIKNGFYE